MVNPEKVEWVEDFTDTLRDRGDLVFTDYKGLTVHELEDLRTALYQNHSRFKVVKNRLAKRAFQNLYEGDSEADDTSPEDHADEADVEVPELEELPGLGPSKVEALEAEGITSVSQVAGADREKLTAVSGIGEATAEKLQDAAREMLEDAAPPEEAGEESTAGQPENTEELFNQLDEWLSGTTAIALNGNGFVNTAQVLVEFSEEHEDLVIKGGVLNDQVLSPDEVRSISELPSRRELLTSLASALQKPIQNLAHHLAYPIQKLARTLNEVKDQKDGDE